MEIAFIIISVVSLIVFILFVCIITAWFNLVKNIEKMARIQYEMLQIMLKDNKQIINV